MSVTVSPQRTQLCVDFNQIEPNGKIYARTTFDLTPGDEVDLLDEDGLTCKATVKFRFRFGYICQAQLPFSTLATFNFTSFHVSAA